MFTEKVRAFYDVKVRFKFDLELFFELLKSGTDTAPDREVFFERQRAESEAFYKKDLVVDTRESWGDWLRRQRDWKDPKLIPREELPEDF